MEIPRPLLEAIVSKKCLPFIGAGFSQNADLPPDKHMPGWDDLIVDLQKDLNTQIFDALEVAQLYDDTFKRPALIDFLIKRIPIFIARPGIIHKFLSKSGLFEVIYTTNFDFLLEDAFKEENIPAMTITSPNQIPFLASSPGVIIVKMHGELPDPDVIITKKDYEKYSETRKAIIAHLQLMLITKTPLFLGYSMRDPNLLQIREAVQNMLGKDTRLGYILSLNADEKEEEEFRRMNLFVISRKSDTKSKRELLLDFLKEISIYKSEQLFTKGIEVFAKKSIVVYGGTLIIQIRIARPTNDPLTLQILNKQKQPIYQNKIKFQENERIIKIPIEGNQWEVDSDYEILVEYDGRSASDTFRVSKPISIIVQTDKSVYVRGTKIIASIINPNIINNQNSMNLEIFGPDGKVCYKKAISIDPDGNGIYQEEILIDGKTWIYDPGSSFKMLAEYADQKAVVYFYTSDFGAAVVLDQKTYTWTDVVTINVIDPDRNLDPNAIDIIGTEETSKIVISTSEHTLSPYKLVETGPDTGHFVGCVVLTGYSSIMSASGVDGSGKSPSNKIGGIGPYDGFIPAKNIDKITVSYEHGKNQIVTDSAIVRWNIGRISWLKPSYKLDEEAVIQIMDFDMNLDPLAIDEFKTKVWSDSDPEGISLTMVETGKATGIFRGIVKFTTGKKSDNNILRVAEGDAVTAEYIDRTLPLPYSPNDQLRLTASTFIGTIIPPLKRITILNSRIVDSSGNTLTSVKVNQKIQVVSDLVNEQDRTQPFAYFVQVQDDNGVTVSSNHSSGEVPAKQSITATQEWMPTAAGTYIIQIFVWQSVNNPNALTRPTQFKINVI